MDNVLRDMVDRLRAIKLLLRTQNKGSGADVAAPTHGLIVSLSAREATKSEIQISDPRSQTHYEEIVAAYNTEKDRATIEATFEALLKFVAALDDESSRAMREGLDPETLTLFDLLKKPELSKIEIDRIKQVAASLLETLESKKAEIDDWRAKEATQDVIRQSIYDFLYDDNTGLPSTYSSDEIQQKSELVLAHIFHSS
jgi:type I restriction enzyme R subunit